MRGRSALAVAFGLLALASPAWADLHHQKHSIDDRLGNVREKIAAAQAHEKTLETEISSTTSRIRTLEAKVGDVSTRLAALQEDLALRQRRLDAVETLYSTQTKQLAFLKREQHLAEARLARRVVQIYESGDTSTLEVVLGARSLQDAIDRVSYFQAIAAQDHRIAAEVGSARTSLATARVHTKRLRDRVRSETRIVAYRVAQQRAMRDELVGARNSLRDARSSRQHDLAVTKESEQEWQQEAESLRAESASLEARIRAAQAAPPSPSPPGSQATPSSTPSSSGLIWPVNGPITSPFGMRWGSLHPGIDIGAGFGTPIHAAASGTVLVAGYNGGYGNLVVLDNGNSISTAYAHQQSIAVTVGQAVTQGQVIGYVGSTGFSTGPHLHFEVRINGSPVDPLGYL
jgi:murein DD-endopeptidase MepM/ murein hydrolase activator NlpD